MTPKEIYHMPKALRILAKQIRHSFEEPRHEYHDEECTACHECTQIVNPDGDGHDDECSIYKSLKDAIGYDN